MFDKMIKVLVIVSWIIGIYYAVSIIVFFWRLSTRYKEFVIALDQVIDEENNGNGGRDIDISPQS